MSFALATAAPTPRITFAPSLFKSAEGSWRGPFFGEGEFGHMFELGSIEDGYQRNLDVRGWGVRNIPAAYAAVMANAKAVSQCWPAHMREDPNKKGRFQKVTTSAAFRIFRQPNDYETWPVFILNLVASMLFEGTGYAVAVRNDKAEVLALHRYPNGACAPFVSPVDGSIYYSIGANQMLPAWRGTLAEAEYIVPARDVLALRQYCPRHPLLGESAASAAALAMGVNVALSRSQAVFFSRMSRPSGILSTDQALGREQMTRLRQNWEAQASKLAQGGVPILGNGVKWYPMSIDSEDSQLNDAQRMSVEDIARVYGVPLPVIGDLSHATLTNVEALISFWLSTSLGSLLELIERAFDKLFGFNTTTDYTELDQNALLRTDFAGRIEALTKGINGSLYSPDEAREKEGLPPVEGGSKVYAQQQMVPLGTTPAPAAPAPAPAPDEGEGEGDEPDGEGGQDDDADTKELPAAEAMRILLDRVRATA